VFLFSAPLIEAGAQGLVGAVPALVQLTPSVDGLQLATLAC
jgi:hypothetical protein